MYFLIADFERRSHSEDFRVDDMQSALSESGQSVTDEMQSAPNVTKSLSSQSVKSATAEDLNIKNTSEQWQCTNG